MTESTKIPCFEHSPKLLVELLVVILLLGIFAEHCGTSKISFVLNDKPALALLQNPTGDVPKKSV